jgi:hypothetical protein
MARFSVHPSDNLALPIEAKEKWLRVYPAQQACRTYVY